MDLERVVESMHQGLPPLRAHPSPAAAGDSRVRLVVSGELDTSAVAALCDAVIRELRASPRELVELDFAQVSFLDSAGVRCLLACRAEADARDCRITVLDPTPFVHQVLEITGLTDLFDVADTARRPAVAPAERTVDLLYRESAAIRHAAREACRRAAQMRRDDGARRARMGEPPRS
jgi:anti-sigma B factor antagonist